MKHENPNILLIIVDQFRADCVGCYNGYPVKTPHLDALAAEGMIFEQCYTPHPLCCPSRQSIMSSVRSEKNGSHWNFDFFGGRGARWLSPSPDFWANQLKKQGYRNYFFGKWHVSPEDSPLEFGYDEMVGSKEYKAYREKMFGPAVWHGWNGAVDEVPLQYSSTHWLAGKVEEAIEACAEKEGPWHIQMDFEEPHPPCTPCEEFTRWYRKEEIPKWAGFDDTFEDKPYIQKQQLYNWNREADSWEDWSEVAARYYAQISQVDDAIGRVIQKLKDTDQWDNTLIIFTSDHGDMCGSHGMFDKHFILYDDVVHIPFIAVWPGVIPAGTRSDQFIYQSLDLGPTIMDVTGGQLKETDGRSLVPLWKGEVPSDWRQEAVASYSGCQFGLYTQRMLRTKRWKYIWNTTDVDELYDLENDKGELHNLVHGPNYQDVLKECRLHLLDALNRDDDKLATGWLAKQLTGEVKKL